MAGGAPFRGTRPRCLYRGCGCPILRDFRRVGCTMSAPLLSKNILRASVVDFALHTRAFLCASVPLCAPLFSVANRRKSLTSRSIHMFFRIFAKVRAIFARLTGPRPTSRRLRNPFHPNHIRHHPPRNLITLPRAFFHAAPPLSADDPHPIPSFAAG